MTPAPSQLLVVTDRTGSPRPLVERIEAALFGGARWIWFRDRDLATVERRSLAEDILGPVREAGARLVIGGDVALACAIGADGIHLGGGATARDIDAARRDLPAGCTLGISAHSPHDIHRAEAAGVNYATLSPIFPTLSKPGYGPALGPQVLRSCRDQKIPVLALGGITPLNTAACREAGFAGVAVMGGVMRADDTRSAVRAHLDAWNDRS
ncbi:thiamine phosphate synthase [Methylobacterium marchantiae]|uniref:Thiamine phosphate synthase n=1 Tax=Methylobacterium marchantiae TaxID=600331 RepID=A0ABW3X1L2_9HYPH|nr:Thiamine-phosphate synthase [Methylobacterium marchantiae]